MPSIHQKYVRFHTTEAAVDIYNFRNKDINVFRSNVRGYMYRYT